MNIEYVDINSIKPYKNNPRKNDNAIDKVMASIKEFGFKNPIIVYKNMEIITGHTRLKAAKKLKIKEVPIIRAEDLTEEQVKAFRIADNKTSEIAEWDTDLLLEEINQLELNNYNIELTGFEINELNKIKSIDKTEIVEDDFDETKVESIIKKNDIWKLGKHLLSCGDSFNKYDINNLMKENKADMAFCDPPYDMKKDEWINNLEFVKNGSPILLMAGDKQTIRLANKIPDFRQFIIHDREQAVLVNIATPMSQHTIISLFCDHPSRYFTNLKDHFTSIIKCNKNYSKSEEKNLSKMGKPVKVPAELISHYSKEEDIILDFFGGGGSTLIACEQLNRICYVNELDKIQCDIIKSRWEQFTGKIAEKVS